MYGALMSARFSPRSEISLRNLHVHWFGVSMHASIRYQTSFSSMASSRSRNCAWLAKSMAPPSARPRRALTREIVAEDGRIAQRQRALHEAS